MRRLVGLWLILIENIASPARRSQSASSLPAATVGIYNFNVTASVRFIPPCSPIPAKAVPTGAEWLHEVKFDGYRVQVHKVGARVVIYSRNGHDFTERFPSIAQLLHELPAKAAVLDGEVIASNADGSPNFARLHVRWARPGAIRLWAFDLLVFNGRDLRLQALVKLRRGCRPY